MSHESCAAGEQSRTRVCTNGTAGEDCIGPQKQAEYVIPNHARYGLSGPGSENVLRRVVLVNKREIECASLKKREKIVSEILKISRPVTHKVVQCSLNEVNMVNVPNRAELVSK